MLGMITPNYPVFDTMQTLVRYGPVQSHRMVSPWDTQYLDLLRQIPGLLCDEGLSL